MRIAEDSRAAEHWVRQQSVHLVEEAVVRVEKRVRNLKCATYSLRDSSCAQTHIMYDERDLAIAVHLSAKDEHVEHGWMHDEEGERPVDVTETGTKLVGLLLAGQRWIESMD